MWCRILRFGRYNKVDTTTNDSLPLLYLHMLNFSEFRLRATNGMVVGGIMVTMAAR